MKNLNILTYIRSPMDGVRLHQKRKREYCASDVLLTLTMMFVTENLAVSKTQHLANQLRKLKSHN